MKTKTLFLLIIFFFMTVFLGFYKSLKNTSTYIPDLNSKKNIPIFEVKLFDSNNLIKSNEIFKEDKFYLMNIWASWCVPCRKEHPLLVNLSNQDNITIIGLNYKDNNKKAKKFLEDLGDPYNIILSDKNGTIAIEWGAFGVPESFLIYNNQILKKFIGPLTNESLFEINKLIL